MAANARQTLATVALLLLLAGALAQAAFGSAQSVIQDCSEDGVLNGHYSHSDLTKALDQLPSDLDEYTDCRDVIRRAHGEFLAGEAPAAPPLLVMTPTATDYSLAPPDRHVVTVWTQWQPRRLRRGSWDDIREQQTQLLIDGVDRAAPGFASSVLATHLQTPGDLEQELDLRGANVMHLDMTLDSMFALRPLPEWSRHRGPDGVYLCGASTHPGGGVSGASGRTAATVVARDLRRRRRR